MSGAADPRPPEAAAERDGRRALSRRDDIVRRWRATGGRGRKLRGLVELLRPYRGRTLLMFAALIAGTVVGALIIARKGAKEGRKTAIPFGPYLALGGLVGLFAGDELVDWYLDTFA